MKHKLFCRRHPRFQFLLGFILALAHMPGKFAHAQTAPPAITSQPRSQSVSLGANVTFRVTATGTPTLSFQWRWNDTPVENATNSTLALTNLTSSQAGGY